MTDYTELKRAASEAVTEGSWCQDGFDVLSDGSTSRRIARCNWLGDAKFIAAANPAVVRALIAENERLHTKLEQARVIGRISCNFDAYEKVLEERDQLKADKGRLERCEDVLRQLASYVGAGGYNSLEVDPEVFARKILDGINILNDPLAQLAIKKGEQIDQLKADNEALRSALKAAEDAMWHADGNMDGNAADARDALAAQGNGEQS